MNEIDRERLTDMLDYARKAVSILGSKEDAEVDADVTTLFALTYAVQVIGEAAGRVSPEGQAEFPTIAWRKIVGMRNRLAHGYSDNQTAIIVGTVRTDLPLLIDILEDARVEDDTP